MNRILTEGLAPEIPAKFDYVGDFAKIMSDYGLRPPRFPS
jgi:hypothetical protein